MQLGGYTRAFNDVARGFEASPSVSADAQISGNNQSFMQRILPQTSFKVEVNTAALVRDSNAHVSSSDLSNVQAMTASARAEVGAMKAAFKSEMQQAQNVLRETVMDVAREQNLDLGSVAATYAPASQSTGATAAMTLAADATLGGAGSALDAVSGIRNEMKKLKPEQQEALLKEVQAQLSLRAEQTSQLVAGSAPDPESKPSSYQFDQLGLKDLEDFLKADPDNEPEVEALEQTEHALDEVEDNHALIQARQNDLTGNKLEAALESGDQAYLDLHADEIAEQHLDQEDLLVRIGIYDGALEDINGVPAAPEIIADLGVGRDEVLSALHHEPDLEQLIPDAEPAATSKPVLSGNYG